MPAERLELEFTEKALQENTQCAEKLLAPLKNLGVRFSVDDFGSAYSNLAMLQKLQVAKLKIDRHFVQTLDCEKQRIRGAGNY